RRIRAVATTASLRRAGGARRRKLRGWSSWSTSHGRAGCFRSVSDDALVAFVARARAHFPRVAAALSAPVPRGVRRRDDGVLPREVVAGAVEGPRRGVAAVAAHGG